jgi:hypothetical protein
LFVVVVIFCLVNLEGFALVVVVVCGRVVVLERGGRERSDICLLVGRSDEGRGGEGVTEVGESGLDVGHF